MSDYNQNNITELAAQKFSEAETLRARGYAVAKQAVEVEKQLNLRVAMVDLLPALENIGDHRGEIANLEKQLRFLKDLDRSLSRQERAVAIEAHDLAVKVLEKNILAGRVSLEWDSANRAALIRCPNESFLHAYVDVQYEPRGIKDASDRYYDLFPRDPRDPLHVMLDDDAPAVADTPVDDIPPS